jgi:hypothetical protein
MQSNGLGKAIICLSLGLLASYTAEAVLITPSTFDFNNQSTASIISHVGSSLAGPGGTVVNLLRLDDLAAPGSGTRFSVAYGAKGNATISWNLTGTGTELEGIYVYGGGSAHLYGVTANGELTGSGSIDTPANRRGKTPGITHILFLGIDSPSSPRTPIPAVPDAANTCILLGASLLGLSFFKNRFSKQRA